MISRNRCHFCTLSVCTICTIFLIKRQKINREKSLLPIYGIVQTADKVLLFLKFVKEAFLARCVCDIGFVKLFEQTLLLLAE